MNGAASAPSVERDEPLDDRSPQVPMIVLILPDVCELCLGPTVLGRLAELGITNVALLRDEETVGLVLEGWAFNPERSAKAAHEVVAGTTEGARTFRPITQMAVSAAPRRGGTAPFDTA